MSGRKPKRVRRRQLKQVRRPRGLRVVFEWTVAGPVDDLIVLRTGAPCNNHQRATVLNKNAWQGLRVNFNTIKPGRFIKALTANDSILRHQQIGGRILKVVPITAKEAKCLTS